MDVAIIIVAAVIGLAAGSVVDAVSRRVFAEPDAPLLRRSDVALALRFWGGGTEVRRRLVQLGTAAAFALVAGAIGWRWALPAYLWFGAVTVLLTLTDVDRKLIPNRITLPGGLIGGAALALGGLLDGDPERLVWMVIGALGYFAFMLVLHLIVPGGLGFGDVKLAIILGGFLGFERLAYVVVGSIGAYVVGGLTSAVLLVTRVKRRKDTIPFGPYMVIGAYTALVFGEQIIEWYRQ